jgi:hypothetical protein
MICLIYLLLHLKQPIRVTSSVTDSEGKKTEEGRMMLQSEPQSEFNLVAIADPPEAQTLTPVATEQS